MNLHFEIFGEFTIELLCIISSRYYLLLLIYIVSPVYVVSSIMVGKVSAIKVHPHTHGFEGLRSGTFSSDDNKCKIGGVKKFERAILLIRDPFDSIWSEYQRRLTQSHVAGIPKKTFNWHRWQANAAALSHKYLEVLWRLDVCLRRVTYKSRICLFICCLVLVCYLLSCLQMWDVQHAGIERHFGNTPESFAQNILYVRYEDLKSSQRRVGALKTIVDFLRLSSKSQSAAELNERLECAFVLAENRQAHRHTDPALFMTKSEAYTRPLACRMWALFGKYAAEHKYGPWANYNCSAGDETNGGVPYPMIPKVNVGPRGEYNFKWVTQGAKKIDFGGYNASAYSPGDDALNKGPRKRTIHKKSHPSTAGGLKQRVNNAGAAGAISGTSSSNKPVANLRVVVVGESVSAPRPLIPVNIANGELESRKESELSVSTGMTLSKASKLTSSGSGVVGASAPAWQ